MYLHLRMQIFDVLIHVGDHIYVSGDVISVVYVCQKYGGQIKKPVLVLMKVMYVKYKTSK